VAKYNIDPASIVINRYSDGAWSRLPTEQTGSDENYLYYRAKTSGFSPFAITGESLRDESTLHSPSDSVLPPGIEDNGTETAADSIGTKINETQAERTLPAIPATITLLIVSFVCFLIRKQ
jgi:hypothetical protein